MTDRVIGELAWNTEGPFMKKSEQGYCSLFFVNVGSIS